MGMSNPSIYANLLGSWTLLSSEDSTIFNEDPYTWLRENVINDHVFIQLGHKGKGYKLHVSHIQITN